MTKLALFDLDGTLSNDSARQQMYQEKRWAEYFSYDAQMADPVWPEGRALYEEMIRDGYYVGYLTARLYRNHQASVDWLTLHGFVNPESVILRLESEHTVRPPQFKARVVADLLRSGKWDNVVLIDNDPLVIECVSEEVGPAHAFHATWSSRESSRVVEV